MSNTAHISQSDSSQDVDALPTEDLTGVVAWMDLQGLGAGPIRNLERLTGGSQNLLLMFERGDNAFVLRRPSLPAKDGSDRTMLREARLLRALAGSDVPHPEMIALCDDPSVFGAVFYLMVPVDGFTATVALGPLHAGSREVRRRMGFAVVEGCAALGAVDYAARGLSDFGNPENYLSRQIERWRRQYGSYAGFVGWPGGESLPGLQKIAAWLAAHQPQHFQPGIMHGDYHLANVMFRHDNAELSAIVDWELATIGDPLLDLAWLLITWQEDGPVMEGLVVERWDGFPTRQELVAHYALHSDRDLSAMDWYQVLAAYKLAIILEGTHARACAGLASPKVGQRLHEGAVRLLDRATAQLQ